jgi:putative alpha-1,2-mannosidase
MGFYSVCPGTDEYVFGSPVFSKVTISLENGKQFIIEANSNSADNVYIQSAMLNGQAYTKNFIRHGDIVNGGKLSFSMGSQPQKDRGLLKEDRPFSISSTN